MWEKRKGPRELDHSKKRSSCKKASARRTQAEVAGYPKARDAEPRMGGSKRKLSAVTEWQSGLAGSNGTSGTRL